MVSYPAPAPGDIVWCKFPEREHIRPAKPRPALVLSVMDDATPIRVRVAYGTSRSITSISATEVLLSPENAAAYALSGVSRPTKLCMTNIVILDYTDFWFDRAPGTHKKPGPQMGVLHPSLMGALRNALKAAGLI